MIESCFLNNTAEVFEYVGNDGEASLCQSKTRGANKKNMSPASGVETQILDEGEVYTWFNPSMLFYPRLLLP